MYIVIQKAIWVKYVIKLLCPRTMMTIAMCSVSRDEKSYDFIFLVWVLYMVIETCQSITGHLFCGFGTWENFGIDCEVEWLFLTKEWLSCGEWSYDCTIKYFWHSIIVPKILAHNFLQEKYSTKVQNADVKSQTSIRNFQRSK